MLASLETRWLKAEKWLPLPTIIIVSAAFADTLNCEGMFIRPKGRELLIEGRCYQEDHNGIIILADNACDGTLAHEFRHHWQYWRGCKYDSDGRGMRRDLPYEQAIVEYFLQSRMEMDALVYEVQKAPRHNRAVEWLEWIRESRTHGIL